MPTFWTTQNVNLDLIRFQSIFYEDQLIYHILPLWNALSARLYEKCSKRVGFNIWNIIFGEYPLNGENKALNCIILHTKQYIFFVWNKIGYRDFGVSIITYT